MNEQLILVDEQDNETGTMDKLSVHEKGLLHRAFSVFVFNSKSELLLQQRADGKYHSGGLWSNTCCSHPIKGEEVLKTIQRRIKDEMGIQCEAAFKFKFIYKMPFENGLTEYELDYVYFGRSDEIPRPNPEEVKGWKYLNLQQLINNISSEPQNYSVWLKVCLPEVMDHFKNNF
jgi:isopentenyl-diphosphate Delta-isomerase